MKAKQFFLWNKVFQLSIIVLSFIVQRNNSFAQQINLHFRHLTPNEGLTQGVINNIFTDSRGFVWMTGLDGINRFDGTKCLANKEIAPGLAGLAGTYGILEDYNGDIWFGYNDGLIKYSYRSNIFTLVPLNILRPILTKAMGQTYGPVVVDADNSIVVGTSNQQFFIYHPDLNKITELPKPVEVDYNISTLFLKKKKDGFKNNLWLGCQIADTFYLYRYGINKNNKPCWQLMVSSFSFNGISSAAMQDDSTLIIINKNQIGKFHFNRNLFEMKSFPEVVSPGLVIDINKNIWIGTSFGGLYAVDGKTLQIIAHYQNEPNNPGSIMNNSAVPYADWLGNLWVAAKFKGVDYCNLADIKFLSSFTQQQSLAAGSSSFIRSIAEDDQGNFYCGTMGGGVVVLNKNQQFVNKLPGIPPQLVCPAMLLQGQSLYIGSDLYEEPFLYKYNVINHAVKKIRNKYKYDNRLDNGNVYQFSRMASGHLLAATYYGLWKLNTTTDEFEKLPGITEENGTIVFSYEDRHGQIYKGVSNGSLSIYQPTAVSYKKVFEIEKKLTVKHCAEINDSLMWIGTSDGLYLFNTQTFAIKKHYTTANGLANNVVYAIMPDDKGNLWLSTNKGLSHFYVTTEAFKHFTVEDGLQNNEFNTHTVVKAKDGRIIFGGVNGLTTIEPAMLSKKSISPIVQLTAIKADSNINPFSFDEKKRLLLSAGSSAIEFDITAICYTNPGKCKIQYRLIGYDDKWMETTNPGIARFIYLPFGSYKFEYRSTNTEGEWISGYKTFPFTIEAYWWQTLQFKLASIFLGTMGILFFIRLYIQNKLLRQQQLLEKNLVIAQERERIIADLHDDVGATLSSMNIYGDLAGNVWDTQPLESRKMIEKISVTSKDLMNRMGDIIWSMKPAGEEKYSFTSRLKNYSSELLSPKNIVCEFDIDENLTASVTNPEIRKNILLIIKEAINNIAKYSQATKAVVSLTQKKETVLLTISDNGKGCQTGPIKPGNGLQNIQQRCKQLNGTCSIKSEIGQGVTIICNFSIARISYSS